MPRTDDAALQQRESGLDSVRSEVAVNVDAARMIDGSMLVPRDVRFVERVGIGSEVICHDDVYVFGDVLPNVLGQRPGFYILRMEEAKLSATLLDADNNFFVGSASAMPLGAAPTAHICLVNLQHAVQRFRVNFLHRCPYAMAEIPRRLVADSERSLDLVGTDAFLGLGEQIDGKEPLPQGKMGVVKDRSSGDGKLIAAFVAVKLIALHNLRNLVGLAAWASNLIRPAKRLKVCAAAIFTAELLDQSHKIYGVYHA